MTIEDPRKPQNMTTETPSTTAHLMRTLRDSQFPQLSSITYLDYTASPPFPRALPETHLNHLQTRFQANPHCDTPPSTLSTDLIRESQDRILSFFNASDDYTVVFTANATAATKLVGEAFPFTRGSRLVLSQDNHNSVLGIRCFAAKKHARVSYIPLDKNLRMCETRLPTARKPSLLAYPAQSNFTGVRHGFDLVHRTQRAGYHVLLDAAAFVPTQQLDLSKVQPDYVTISFYKMFGYPTGVGALIVQKDALAVLHRPSFSGGTIEWVAIHPGRHMLVEGAEGFHDGTPNFLHIPAVMDGLSWVERIGIRVIGDWIARLTGLLLQGLARITDADGRRVIRVYGPENSVDRGGTVAFDVVFKGRRVRSAIVTRALAKGRVFVREGCFCNPGCGNAALGIGREGKCARGPKEDVSRCLGAGLGFVRASVGLGALEEDVERLVHVLSCFCEEVERGDVVKPFWEVEKGRTRGQMRLLGPKDVFRERKKKGSSCSELS